MGKLKSLEQLTREQGTLYGDQRERARNVPKPVDKVEPKCPQSLPKPAKAAWRYCAAILKNWGLLNISNAPHLEMFAVNWAWYQWHRQKSYEFEQARNPEEDPPKRNRHIGPMNIFEKKAQRNLSDMGVGTMGLAKVGQAVVRAKKKEGIEALLD